MQIHLTPAAYVCRVFGGQSLVAGLLGINRSRVCRWQQQGTTERGQSGRIPHQYQAKLLRLAKDAGHDLTPTDLILGREVAAPEPSLSM
jgi:hypothetical protein